MFGTNMSDRTTSKCIVFFTLVALCLQFNYVDAGLRANNNNNNNKPYDEGVSQKFTHVRNLRENKKKNVDVMLETATEVREDANKLRPFSSLEVSRTGFEIEISLDDMPLYDESATQTSEPSEARIIGGSDASQEYKYFTMLLHRNSQGRYAWSGCGGTLIAPDMILTAGHCVYGKENQFEYAYINAYAPWIGNYKPDGSRAYVDFRVITDIYIHENYTHGNGPSNDFALLKLHAPARDYFAPIGLPSPSSYADLDVQDDFTIIGFGHTEWPIENASPPTTLQEAEVSFVPEDVCNQAFASHGNLNVDSSMMCAKGEGYTIDACQGDSGGPLIQKNNNGNDVIMGVTSWGVGCAQDGYPGVYSRVSSALSWIHGSICEHSADSASKQASCDALIALPTPQTTPTGTNSGPGTTHSTSTDAPTPAPTSTPTSVPTSTPTSSPTDASTSSSTSAPTSTPTSSPTNAPTSNPTIAAENLPIQTCDDVQGDWFLRDGNKIKRKDCSWNKTRKHCDETATYNGEEKTVEELCPQECRLSCR